MAEEHGVRAQISERLAALDAQLAEADALLAERAKLERALESLGGVPPRHVPRGRRFARAPQGTTPQRRRAAPITVDPERDVVLEYLAARPLVSLADIVLATEVKRGYAAQVLSGLEREGRVISEIDGNGDTRYSMTRHLVAYR